MDLNSERKNTTAGVLVRSVAPESPLAAVLEPGDRLLSLNGEPVRDEIDLLFLGADERLEVLFSRGGAAPRRATVDKSFDTPLAVGIAPRPARRCRNPCVFCFVDQNPPTCTSAPASRPCSPPNDARRRGEIDP